MILFRADGNNVIGSGHVMRCLSIADAFRELGEESVFVCADSSMKARINDRGYDCVVLGTDYRNLLSETEKLFSDESFKNAKYVIVDSYYVSTDYFSELKKHKKTVYIDDLYIKTGADVIINYNIYADTSKYYEIGERGDVCILAGPQYAPLRKEFSHTEPKKINERAEKVLVLTGGADPCHVALEFAKRILLEKETDPVFYFVAGAMSQDIEELKDLESKSSGRMKIFSDVKDMKSLMCECDLAVSAAGSTLYELCACGVPTINYCCADNQKEGSERFAEEGIMITASDARNDDFIINVLDKTKIIAYDRKKRAEMSERAKRIVDGKGADRTARKLEEIFS